MGGGHQPGDGFRPAVQPDGSSVIGTAAAGKIPLRDAVPLQRRHPFAQGVVHRLRPAAFAVKHGTDEIPACHHLAAEGRIDLPRLVQAAVQVGRFSADEVQQQLIQQAVAHIFLFAALRLKADLKIGVAMGIFCSQ